VSSTVLRSSAGAPPRFSVRGARGAAVALASLVAGALVWQYIGNHTQQASFVSFTKTLSALWALTKDGELWHASVSSLKLFAAGLVIALAIGFVLGLLLARIRTLRIGLEPYIAAMYATPMVALIPFILAVFGFEFRSKLIVVVLFGLWPILINTLEGARSVNQELLEVAASYRSTEPKLWWHVIVPYTLPFTMTGVRQSIARCLVGMVASEFLLSASGLGELIIVNTQRFETANVLASVLAITLLATLLMALGRALENYFARWRAGA
jgi:ABC-type nitrate/sulfonate/bicarbonate transport system permease component